MPDIICLGEPIVDMVCPEPARDLVAALNFNKLAGGAPLNVAAAAAQLGASSGVICQTGRDHFGDFMRQSMEACGVETTGFLQHPDYATQLAFVALDEQGVPDFDFHVKRSADQMLEPSQLDRSYITSAKIFHFGTITLIDTPVRDATIQAVQWAAEAGLTISLDPNLRESLWPDLRQARKWFEWAISRCDFLKISKEEMEFVTGAGDLEKGAAALQQMGPELIAVTLGPEGAYAYVERYRGHIPGFAVQVADTVGCGDAFTAGVLVGLLESKTELSRLPGESVEDIMTFANAAAALTATDKGGIPAMPARQQVDQFLPTQQ